MQMSRMLSGRRAVVIVCVLLQGLVVFSLTSRFFVNSHLDHSWAWILRARVLRLCSTAAFPQGLHCTHFLKHQYPSTPHPLFPIYPRTVRGSRASAVLLFYTDQMNRVHSSKEAPRSFTMAPCVDVERFEGKKRCRRAAVSEHAGIQARE